MIIVDEEASCKSLSTEDAIAAVEQAFIALELGDGHIFPVAHGEGPLAGSSFSMKAGCITSLRAVGLKVGSYWPTNVAAGIPSHNSTVILLDPDTGELSAVVATSHLNSLRTAAADALAVRQLARVDAQSLGLVGAGHQAWFDCMAVLGVRSIKHVRVWSRSAERAESFVARLRAEGISAETAPLSEVAACDVIITATASREPIVDPRWLRPGCHLSAMGADAGGKRELRRPYLLHFTLFADLAAQSRRIGEFQGLNDPIHDLGAVLTGRHPGRTSEDEITIFDSSGLAVQDLAIASWVLRKVRSKVLEDQTSTPA